MKFNYHALPLLLGLLPFVSNPVIAENKLSSWSIKGFGTLAATGTDTDKIGFYRDLSQTQDVTNGWGITTDSRLGLQVDWQASNSLHATVQWVARDHAGNFGEQNLDWAFLRWRLQDNVDIRLGRLGFDTFLLSDYRNVGYAYPWMRPPHEFYSILPFYHFDGADITKKFAVDDGYLSIKTFAGHTFNQLPTQLGTNNQSSTGTGISLRYENNNWRATLGYIYANNTSELPIQSIKNEINNPLLAPVWPNLRQVLPSLTMKGKVLHYVGAGVAYDDSIWLTQMEASYIASNTPWIVPQAHAYLSVGRRFSTITLYSLLGIAKSFQQTVDVPNPLIPSSALINKQQQLTHLLNDNGVNEQSISIGTRWDFHENMALKAQWSHYWLGNDGRQQWQQTTINTAPNTVNVMSTGIDFVF